VIEAPALVDSSEDRTYTALYPHWKDVIP